LIKFTSVKLSINNLRNNVVFAAVVVVVVVVVVGGGGGGGLYNCWSLKL
jgi:hypothetical protein